MVFIIYHYDIHSIIFHYIWFNENKYLFFIFILKEKMTSFWHLILFIFLTLKEEIRGNRGNIRGNIGNLGNIFIRGNTVK